MSVVACRTQQWLQGAAAVLQSVSGVSGGEEDRRRETRSSRVQPESHRGQQSLPAGHAAHLILHTLLRRVHGVPLAVLNALERFLHLGEPQKHRWFVCTKPHKKSYSYYYFNIFEWKWNLWKKEHKMKNKY